MILEVGVLLLNLDKFSLLGGPVPLIPQVTLISAHGLDLHCICLGDVGS